MVLKVFHVAECNAKGDSYGTVLYSYTEQCRVHWKLDKGVGIGLNFCKFMHGVCRLKRG
jgi:hypothetical protein